MSCCEHVCCNQKCNTYVFNNDSRSPWSCPKCGADMSHFWDEQNDEAESKRYEPEIDYSDEEEE